MKPFLSPGDGNFPGEMKKLVDIDDVAYVRFASVYKDFKDIDTFKLELDNITKNK